MNLSITHTAEEGTLLDGTSRGDGTNIIVKPRGWRFSRNLGLWYLPNSRDRIAKRHVIDATAAALTAAGHEVSVDIDDTTRPTELVEADRAARQEDRVDALEAKAARKDDAAVSAENRSRQAHEALPPFGEPIKVGHHSERRHRRAIDKSRAAMGASVAADKVASVAHDRAETAARTTDRRYSPVTVANRIDKLEAEQRGDQRLLDGYTRIHYVVEGVKYGDEFAAATGDYRERVIARMAERTDQLDFWRTVRAKQVADGTATDFSRDTVAKGDRIKYRHSWYPVVRVNAKTVTIGNWLDIADITWKVEYAEIQAVNRPEAKESP